MEPPSKLKFQLTRAQRRELQEQQRAAKGRSTPKPPPVEKDEAIVDTAFGYFGEPFRHLVVHCKHSKYDVYVGRPPREQLAAEEVNPATPSHSPVGTWGNPFRMRRNNLKERRRVIERYSEFLFSKPDLMLRAKAELKGKVLACYCSPQACHAHVLAAVANDDSLFPGSPFPSTIVFSPQLPPPPSSCALLGPSRGEGGGVGSVTNVDGGGSSGGGGGSGSSSAWSESQEGMLVDIGVNLTNRQFSKDAAAVVARAAAAGVKPLVVTGTSVKESKAAHALCKHLSHRPETAALYYTAGVHPHNASAWVPGNSVGGGGGGGGGGDGAGAGDGGTHSQEATSGASGAALRVLLADPKCVAVGECGLDFNRDFSPRPIQEQCFAEQLELACELGKSLFLHERDAFASMQRVLSPFLSQRRLPPAVVHCFTGTAQEAAWYLSQGFFLGFAGTVCLSTRGRHLREEVLPLVPLNRLMVETDAPFMHPGSNFAAAAPTHLLRAGGGPQAAAAAAADEAGPVGVGGGFAKRKPHGKRERCEPRHVIDVCAAVAAAKNLTFEEVAAATTANAQRFFGLKSR